MYDYLDTGEEATLRLYYLFKDWLYYEGYLPKKSSNKAKFVQAVKALTGWNSCITKKSAFKYMYKFLEAVYPEDLASMEIEATTQLRNSHDSTMKKSNRPNTLPCLDIF